MALRASSRMPSSAAPTFQKDELAEELKQKTILLASVQRNYDAISRIIQARTTDMEKMKLQLEAEKATVASLGDKLHKALAAAQRAESQAAHVAGLETQVNDLKQQQDRQRFEASLVQGRLNTANETIARLQRQAEEGEARNRLLRREAEAKGRDSATAEAATEQLRCELQAANRESRALESEIRALRDQLSRCDNRAAAAEQRAGGLERTNEVLQRQLAAMRDQSREMSSSIQLAKDARAAAEVALEAAKQNATVLDNRLRTTTRLLQISEEGRAATEAELKQLQATLEAAQEELGVVKGEYQQMEARAKLLEKQYSGAASSNLQASDLLRDLQQRLDLTRLQLQDAQVGSQTSQQAHKREEQALKARIGALEGRCKALTTALAHAGFNVAEVAGKGLEAAEQLAGKVQKLGERADEVIVSIQQHYEAILQEVMAQLLSWAESFNHVDVRVASFGPMLAAVEKLLSAGHARAMAMSWSTKARDGQDTELRAEVVQLKDELAIERQARAAASEDFARQKAHWNEQVLQAAASARKFAEETLNAERGRHAAHLSELKTEITGLQVAWQADKASSQKLLEMERSLAQQGAAKLRQEVTDSQAAAEAAGKAAEAAMAEEQALRTRLLGEMDKRLKAETVMRQRLEAELGIARSNLESAYNVGKAMLGDMLAVSQHMSKMGVPIPMDAAGAGGLPDVEDGTGSPSVRLGTAARLQFSYITETVQNMLRDLPGIQRQNSLVM